MSKPVARILPDTRSNSPPRDVPSLPIPTIPKDVRVRVFSFPLVRLILSVILEIWVVRVATLVFIRLIMFEVVDETSI